MIDIKLIRDEYKTVEENYKRRKDPAILKVLKQVKEFDEEWRKATFKAQDLKKEQNTLSQSVNEAKKAGKDIKAILKKVADIKRAVEDANMVAEDMRLRAHNGLMRLPNLLDDSVPYGKDETENEELRASGKIKEFTFELKPHSQLAEELGIADFERARKTSGAGFSFMKGDLVRLHQALIQFALDKLGEKGFVPVEPPLLMRREACEGVTDLEGFENVMYKSGEDEYWVPTSEYPLIAMHMDEVIEDKCLPVKYVGVSPCFRREIGAHGIDEKGFFRMHQFWKVEQIIFCAPEDSEEWHEKLIANSEELFNLLELPFRVVNICTGDIGTVAAKKYDIDAWMPRSKEYKEVVSGSNCTDYQARRLNIKCGSQGGDKRYVHTLNCTGVATSRALVAILENYQNKDGSLSIPKVLQPYMGGQKKISIK